jgi:membrane-associated phospholipid phosphatase
VRRRTDIVLGLLLVALTVALLAGALLSVDVGVRDWVDGHRPPPLYWTARVLNYLGQGGLLQVASLLAALWVVRRHRSLRPLLPVVAAYVGLLFLIGPIKVLTDRVAPHGPSGSAEFFTGGMSYPSGHVANTIVWYGVLSLLLGSVLGPAARRWLRILPPVIVFVITTYLGFHWLTDSIAGLFAGLLLDRALRRVDWNRVPLPSRVRMWAHEVPELSPAPGAGPSLR